MNVLVHIFFISFILNIFFIIYSFYSKIDLILLGNQQGLKLKFKKRELKN